MHTQSLSNSRSSTHSTSRALIIALLLASVLALPACKYSPLAEHEDDVGKRIALDRLRTIDRLYIDEYRKEAPTPAAPAIAAAPETLATQQPPNVAGTAGRLANRPTVSISVQQARASALQNNLDLQVSLVDPSIAGQSLRAERAKFDAVFRPFLDYSKDFLNTTSLNSGRSEQLRFGTGVDIPLRTGGRATVDLTQSRLDSSGPDQTVYGSGLEFSISQPLLRNAGREANTASIKIAAYNAQIAETRTKLAVINTIATVERSYWRLYARKRELQVAQQQYELASEQLVRAQRRVKAGTQPEVEELRAQSGVAQRLDAIITAENNVLLEQRELKRLMNSPDMNLGDTALVMPETEPNPMPYELDGANLVQFALDNRMELLETELTLLADTVNIDLAKNEKLPGLDVNAGYGISGTATNFGRGQEQFFKGRFNAFTVGISGDIPLSNERREASYQSAILTRIQRLSTLEARKLIVRQDTLDAIDRLTANWQRILAARQSTILAARTLQAEQRQFDVGRRTSFEVLDAVTSLADAQLQEIRALTDYQISQIDLAVATGTVLGEAGIAFTPREDDPTVWPAPSK